MHYGRAEEPRHLIGVRERLHLGFIKSAALGRRRGPLKRKRLPERLSDSKQGTETGQGWGKD